MSGQRIIDGLHEAIESEIPEWAWEAAREIREIHFGAGTRPIERDIARALLSAVEKERSACAEIAEEYASIEMIGQVIAAEIRARSNA